MKVKRMIAELRNHDPEAEVKLHHPKGNNALFVLTQSNDRSVVWVEDKDDNDMRAELSARIEYAVNEGADELDFCMDLLEIGVTLQDIKQALPEQYDYFRQFMLEHGLLTEDNK